MVDGEATKAPRALHVALWIAQVLLGVTLAGGGLWKLLTPLAKIGAMMPWTIQVTPAFFHATAVIDLCGGIGVVVPAATRIKPGLTVLAALGCALLMVSAIVFHVSRGEAAKTPFNFVLLALALFIAWGRRWKAPIRAV